MFLDFKQIHLNNDTQKSLHHGLLGLLQKVHRSSSPWYASCRFCMICEAKFVPVQEEMQLVCGRFIYAFGGAGLFLCITATSGLYGASYNSRHCLNFYSTMVVVMLLAQCALLVGYFADKSWKHKLPHDDTGEAARVCTSLL